MTQKNASLSNVLENLVSHSERSASSAMHISSHCFGSETIRVVRVLLLPSLLPLLLLLLLLLQFAVAVRCCFPLSLSRRRRRRRHR
jgi:hypothetical protein